MNKYKTQNLYEASYLLTKGFSLAGKEQAGNKVVVLFEGEDIQGEAMKFYNGGRVNAKLFCDNYRTMKDYIFER